MSLRILLAITWLAWMSAAGWGQASAVKGQVIVETSAGSAARDASGVVVWLTPASNVRADVHANAPTKSAALPHPRLVQTGKHFEPHLLVVPVGTAVEFPNKDPFFHNVFSLFEGKRFDLGLYEAGSTRTVRFDKPGISYIFCNIHPEMSAVVIALATPYYATSNAKGEIVVPDVPLGRYVLDVWFERSLPEELARIRRIVNVSDSDHSLGTIRLPSEGHLQARHKNKYGKDYDDQAPSTPGYTR